MTLKVRNDQEARKERQKMLRRFRKRTLGDPRKRKTTTGKPRKGKTLTVSSRRR